MIRLIPPALSAQTAQHLATHQREIDALPSYEARVSEGKARWKKKKGNRAGERAFDEISDMLSAMSFGRRCHYCEDSAADEVEHIAPKDLYPDLAFVWDNYLYACGPCNGPKNNKFSVFNSANQLVNVTRQPKAAIIAPLAGEPVLINPREEDPLDYIRLDLITTFRFQPIDALLPEAQRQPKRMARAEYTINTLKLNRSYLTEMRRDAFNSYLSKLIDYVLTKNRTPHATQLLEEHAQRLRTGGHRAVWESMKRQRHQHPKLAQFFALGFADGDIDL